MPADVTPGLSVIVPIASRQKWQEMDDHGRATATTLVKAHAKKALAQHLAETPHRVIPVGDIRWAVAHLDALAAPFHDLGEDDPGWTTVVLLASQSVLQAVE